MVNKGINLFNLNFVSRQIRNTTFPISEFGKHIKTVREALGMTQKQLAKRAGITQQAVNKIENSSFSPSISTITKISTALSIDVNIQLLPENDLETMVRMQAEKKARQITPDNDKISETTQEIITNSKNTLWED